MWYFSMGGAKSVTDIDTGGQKPYISTNAQCYHYSFCPRGGPNSIDNFDGGHVPICPPWIRHWGETSAHKKDLTRMWKGELGWRVELSKRWGKVWNSKELNKATKTRMYEVPVLVLITLLYNTEKWTLRETQKQRLRVFEMVCLRKIEGVTRRDRIRNEEIFNRLNIRIGIIERMRNKRLRYFGVWTSEQDEQ